MWIIFFGKLPAVSLGLGARHLVTEGHGDRPKARFQCGLVG